jgi:putative transposase
VRAGGQVTSHGVLIVSGVREDGKRAILAVEVADTESAATYMTLFRDLKVRGLRGVRLVTSDDHAGLKAAIDRYFQGAGWQRCRVHYQRNLLGMVGASRRNDLAADLRLLLTATTLPQARATADQIADRWRATHPAVARSLEDQSEACFARLAFPLAHQARIRTTNGMERLNQELKRRTRVIRIFPNREACLRLVTALCMEQSEEWESGRQYLDISELPPTFRQEAPMTLVG